MLLAESVEEYGIFDAADAVADAGGLQQLQGFPNTGRTSGFAGVSRAVELMLASEFKCGNVSVQRMSGFVTGDVDGDNIGAAKAFHQVGGLKTLFGVEVT